MSKEYRLRSLEARPVLVFGEHRIEIPPLPGSAIDQIMQIQERLLKAWRRRISDDPGEDWSYASEMREIREHQKQVILACAPGFPEDQLGFDVQREVWNVILEIAGLGGGASDDEEAEGEDERPTKQTKPTKGRRRSG